MRQLALRSLPVASPHRFGVFSNGLYSGIRHNMGGVHNRLGNVSAAVRKRNYHVGGKGGYRMGNSGFFERKWRQEEQLVSRGTNRQLTVDNALAEVRRRVAASNAHDRKLSRHAAGIMSASERPPGSVWKRRNWSSSFTTTSCGSRAEIAASF